VRNSPPASRRSPEFERAKERKEGEVRNPGRFFAEEKGGEENRAVASTSPPPGEGKIELVGM